MKNLDIPIVWKVKSLNKLQIWDTFSKGYLEEEEEVEEDSRIFMIYQYQTQRPMLMYPYLEQG